MDEDNYADYAIIVRLYIDDDTPVGSADIMAVQRNILGLINEDWLRDLLNNRLDELLSADIRERVSIEVY